LVYGTAKEQAESKDKAEKAKKLAPAPAADRAAYSGKKGGGMSYDLVEALKAKKVDLARMKDEELPPELRKLKTTKEREEYVKQVEAKRAELNKEAVELDRKRSDYIKKEQEKKGKKAKDGFDESVLQMLRKQAAKHKIEY